MSKDPMDLPVRRVTTTSAAHHEVRPIPRVSLNERQVSSLIETGGKVAEGLMAISNDLIEISRIKAESQAEVAGIEARSSALVAALRAETDRLMALRKNIRTRGEAAAEVIRAVLENIPESDIASRQSAVAILSQLVVAAVSGQDCSPQP